VLLFNCSKENNKKQKKKEILKMRKLTKEITFEGINEQIREAMVEKLGIEEAKEELFLDDLCEKNDIRLLLKIGDRYVNECEIGYNDDDTSENICDAILEMYVNTLLIDEEIYENPISISLVFDNNYYTVGVLDLKEYVELTIVDKFGNETDVNDNDLYECIVSAVDTSLNNNNLQHTKIYKDIFKDEDAEYMDDDEYNDKYNDLINKVVESFKKYMLCDSGQQFNFRPTKRFVSGYFAFSIPDVRDAYNEDICDVLYYEDR
jgi:hypothetical protein